MEMGVHKSFKTDSSCKELRSDDLLVDEDFAPGQTGVFETTGTVFVVDARVMKLQDDGVGFPEQFRIVGEKELFCTLDVTFDEVNAGKRFTELVEIDKVHRHRSGESSRHRRNQSM